MSRSKDSPLQTLHRFAIMVGTLACVSLAWCRYGPPPGQLAEMIDGVAARVTDFQRSASESAATPEAANRPGAIAADGASTQAIAIETAAPRFDPAVQQASALQPLVSSPTSSAPPNTFDRLERERLTAPLLAAGALTADVAPWGRGPQAMYRATASVAVGGPATGLKREFDAIAPTPDAAVAALQEQLRVASAR